MTYWEEVKTFKLSPNMTWKIKITSPNCRLGYGGF